MVQPLSQVKAETGGIRELLRESLESGERAVVRLATI
jgi:hypothetical protein